MAVTFQDVGIDSLAVDIMAEDERAKAAGIMFGAQLLGTATATFLGGILLANYGISACLAVLALVPALVALYGVLIREREGERRLPWTAGVSHPLNRAVQVEAWWPLLVNAWKAMILPLSLLLIPMLLFRSLPAGGFEAFHPVLYTQTGGWSLTDYTNFSSTLGLATGLTGLIIGGWLVDAIGAQRSALIAVFLGVLALAGFGSVSHLWPQSWLLTSFGAAMEFIALLYAIAMIPICMRMCSPAVAATQFTIYMAIGNFGRPLGAWLAANTAGAGLPEWMYWSLAGSWAIVAVTLLIARFPTHNRAEAETAHVLPQGDGLQPIEN
jgi:PAT family beta-lactamase induction signal transducer AmpG